MTPAIMDSGKRRQTRAGRARRKNITATVWVVAVRGQLTLGIGEAA